MTILAASPAQTFPPERMFNPAWKTGSLPGLQALNDIYIFTYDGNGFFIAAGRKYLFLHFFSLLNRSLSVCCNACYCRYTAYSQYKQQQK